jgi:hypothetical protein
MAFHMPSWGMFSGASLKRMLKFANQIARDSSTIRAPETIEPCLGAC